MNTERSEAILVSAQKVFRVTVWFVLGLAALSLSLRCGETFFGMHPTRKFDLDTEGNIPNFISATLLAIVAGLFWIIGTVKKKGGEKSVWSWKALSIVWALLAFDEAAAIHEGMNSFFNGRLHLSGFFHWGWVIAGFPCAVVFGLVVTRFARQLPIATSKNMILAMAIYFGSAVGIEMIGGRVASQFGTSAFLYQVLATAEETGEMLGTALMMHALLDYLGWYAKSLQVKWPVAEPDAVAATVVQRAVVREISRKQPSMRTDPWKVAR